MSTSRNYKDFQDREEACGRKLLNDYRNYNKLQFKNTLTTIQAEHNT